MLPVNTLPVCEENTVISMSECSQLPAITSLEVLVIVGKRFFRMLHYTGKTF